MSSIPSAVMAKPSYEMNQGQMENMELQISNLKKMVEEEPNNYNAFMSLGKIYLQEEMWEESLYYFLRAEVIQPVAEVYLSIAELFFKKEKFKKSIEYYNKAEKAGKPLFEIYWNKGLAHERLKERKEAVSQYIKAYSLKSELKYCYKIAPMALQAGMFQDAIGFYEILLEKEEKPLWYAEMGLAYMELREYEKSKACYQKAKELSKLSEKHRHIEEITYDDFVAQYPDIEKKIQAIRSKIEKNAAEYHDHYDMGNMMFIRGLYQESAAYYQKAKEHYIQKISLTRS